MLSNWLKILLIYCIPSVLSAQGMRDSVFQIREVEIAQKMIFKKEEAGMKQTKLDSLILADKVHLSLSELLSANTQVFIKNHGRGALSTASFRGTSASHTQVNWNGININNPMTGMVDFSLIPIYIVDEINLKHGNASISDRNGGLGGAVNLKSTVNWDKKTGFRFIQGIGSYQTFDEFLEFNKGNANIQSKTRLYHNQSKNNYTFINRRIGKLDPVTGEVIHPLDTNDQAAYNKSGILHELYYRPNDKNMLSLKYWGQWAERSLPRVTSFEGPDHSNINTQKDNDQKLVFDWKKYKDKSTFIFSSGFSGKVVNYSMKNLISGIGTIPAAYSESKQSSFLNNLSHKYRFNESFSFKHAIDIDVHDVSTHDSVSKTGYQKHRFEISYLFNLQKSIKDRLNLNLMMRQDWIDQKHILIPYLGFDYRLIKGKDFYIKGNIARNYHVPSLNEMYWQPGGNPNLKPEKGLCFETGTAYRLKKNTYELNAEITAFRSDITNWIIWIPSYKGYWEPRNIKKVLARGVELNVQLKGNFGEFKYFTTANYAYTRSMNKGDPRVWGDVSVGKQLVYIPLHSGNWMVNINYKGYMVSYQHTSYSERYTTSSNDITRRDWLYPYFMNDLSLGKEVHMRKTLLSAKFKIYNLFDENYHSVLYRPMPGRNYMLLLMIKF